MKRTLAVLFTITLTWLGFSPAEADAVGTVRIGVVSLYATGKVQLSGIDYVIDQQGWLRGELAKRGIKLEWFPAPNAAVGPVINEAFASGQIQFASYGELPPLILNGSGPRIRAQLLVPSLSTGSDAYLLVPENSSAKSIVDLKGKKLGINKGRPWEIPLLRLLDSQKLSYNDFQVYNINPDAAATAVATGAIDGSFTISPYGLVDKKVAKIIWSTKQAPASWKMVGGFWGSKDFIDAHPDITQLVVTAYVKAALWASDEKNRETFIKLGTRNGTPESIVRETYDDPNLAWKDRWSPLISPAMAQHFREVVGYAYDKKIIRNRIDPAQFIDQKPVETALKQLNLETYWSDVKPVPVQTLASGK